MPNYDIMAEPPMSTPGIRQTDLRERTARDFVPNEGLRSGGILCVFPALQAAQSGQKIRCPPKPVCLADARRKELL